MSETPKYSGISFQNQLIKGDYFYINGHKIKDKNGIIHDVKMQSITRLPQKEYVKIVKSDCSKKNCQTCISIDCVCKNINDFIGLN